MKPENLLLAFKLSLILIISQTVILVGSTKPEPKTEMGKRHYALAKQTELESIVLLKNQDNLLPLSKSKQDRVAVFGNGAFVPTNGSNGSGTVSGAFTYNLYDGLNSLHVEFDEAVYNRYNENITVSYGWGVSVNVNHNWNTSDKKKWGEARFSNSGWNMSSPIANPELNLDDKLVSSAAAFSSDKTAIVYITRGVGTEEMDRYNQPSDWYLNPSEYTMLKQVTKAFEKVIIILNTSGSIDLSWMNFEWLAGDPDYNEGGKIGSEYAKSCADKIKGLIISYGSGSYHGLVMAELLYGEEDFSGKLADSMTETYEAHPTKDNFHYKSYADKGLNYADFNSLNGKDDPIYLYQEDIFTGYRYFQTFAARDILYPFGFGLSYNQYAFSEYKINADAAKKTISISATIQNVSENNTLPAGKEVMQVYVSAPEGDLEQPYQKLVDYAKTKKLSKGQKETIQMNIPISDLASYDEKKAAYILEKGDYIIRVGNSSQNTHIAGIMTVEQTIIAEQLSNKLTLNGADPKGKADNKSVFDKLRFSTTKKYPSDPNVYGYKNPNDKNEIQKAKANAIVITKEFANSNNNSADKNYFKPGNAPQDYVATLTSVKKGQTSLDDFVSQMTKDELVNLLSGGFGARNSEQHYSDDIALQINNLTSKDSDKGWIGGAGSSRTIQRLGIPSLTYADGSAGISVGNTTAEKLGIDQNPGFARAAGIACSWNPELQYEWGKAIGEEMLAINVDIWLAPSINLHRNPLNGRNTEYYSEDPVLSGKIASQVARGVAENGVTVCLKHFAGNDQEWFRRGLHTFESEAAGTNKDAANTIIGERALREVTLKPFEIAVKTGQVMCVMSAFNKINGKYCATSQELLTDILRDEWNFKGYVVTDWGDFDEIPHAAAEMQGGNDMIMSGFHNRFKISDQIFYNTVDDYTGNPNTVSMDQLRRNAYNVLKTALFSKNAFTDNDNYNLDKHTSSKLEILTTQLPVAVVGINYNKIKVNPLIAGGSEGTTKYVFSVDTSGEALPAAIKLAGNGTLQGIPQSNDTGTCKLVLKVEDDKGNTATKSLEFTVANMDITTSNLPVGRLEMDYSTRFNGIQVLGGKAPVYFKIKEGNLPQGIELTTDGRITGIPQQTGNFNFSIEAKDKLGYMVQKRFVMTIEDVISVSLTPPSQTDNAKVNNSVNIGLAASRTGFNDAYEYILLDAPSWLHVGSNWFGTNITGIPDNAGTYRFRLRVNIVGSDIHSEIPYTIIVQEEDSSTDLEITTESLPSGRVNVPYSFIISTRGGKGTKTFTLDDNIPAGLTLSQNGNLLWTPAGLDFGFYDISVRVADKEGHETAKTFKLYIEGTIVTIPVHNSSLTAGTGKEFNLEIKASGGTVDSYTYSISNKGDKLPKGLKLEDGKITGVPQQGEQGEYSVIIRISENGGSFSGSEVLYNLKITD